LLEIEMLSCKLVITFGYTQVLGKSIFFCWNFSSKKAP